MQGATARGRGVGARGSGSGIGDGAADEAGTGGCGGSAIHAAVPPISENGLRPRAGAIFVSFLAAKE